TVPLVELRNSALFSLFGFISPLTPRFSTQSRRLYFSEEVTPQLSTSFYYPHPDSLVEIIADNIARLRDSLRLRYNADFLFLPVPNKYTVYNDEVGNDPYDNFLPRIVEQLRLRHVNTVDLYVPFQRAKATPLYYATDTHWDSTGI